MALNGAPDQKTKETRPKRPTLTSQKPPSDPSRRRQAKNSRFFEVSSFRQAFSGSAQVASFEMPLPNTGDERRNFEKREIAINCPSGHAANQALCTDTDGAAGERQTVKLQPH
ncbi:hypothetical protein [Novosphingobium sp. CCH12-A3]|uniref:hypothetical protein n=1 Tax=Novosphingobium sp. CCH12-A3 TaxID=1768752 RepID=UPI0012E35CA7|nr:hypothetical protein [Novosphingobium sp. CCH12-A3]